MQQCTCLNSTLGRRPGAVEGNMFEGPRLPFWVKSCPDSPEVKLPLYPRNRTQLGHRAMSERCQQETHAPQHHRAYSITSSARASSVGEILNPIVRAVFRLTLSWNLVGNSTGRSRGFLPLRILSTNVARWPDSALISAE